MRDYELFLTNFSFDMDKRVNFDKDSSIIFITVNFVLSEVIY